MRPSIRYSQYLPPAGVVVAKINKKNKICLLYKTQFKIPLSISIYEGRSVNKVKNITKNAILHIES